MKNKLKISIGISAYNEENNIEKIINDVLSQEQNNWQLSEILIYCDGCSDGTVEKISRIKSRFIKMVVGKERKGKTYRLKQIFKIFSGDIIVILDADIALKDKLVISNLIKPIVLSSNVMLIGGNPQPFPPVSFFEKAVYTTFSVFYKSRKYINGGNNIFGCSAQLMALRKELAKTIILPRIINEDAYIYLYCISKGYKFNYVDNAVSYYKLPKNIGDYVRQVFRSDPKAVTLELHSYYKNLVNEAFYRPFKFYFRSILEVFIENPLGVITIVSINIICKALIPVVSKNYKLEWFTAESTK